MIFQSVEKTSTFSQTLKTNVLDKKLLKDQRFPNDPGPVPPPTASICFPLILFFTALWYTPMVHPVKWILQSMLL